MRLRSSSDDWRLPPKDVSPERLFRLLSRLPRPVLPLDYRFPCAPLVRLYARALTPAEDAALRDIEGGVPLASEIVRLALCDDDGPALPSLSDIGQMMTSEVVPAAEAITKALRVISPQMARVDHKAWLQCLKQGAAHPTNTGITLAMAAANERTLGGKHPAPRIDRYYGVPLSQLTDGQRLAFTAAYGVVYK